MNEIRKLIHILSICLITIVTFSILIIIIKKVFVSFEFTVELSLLSTILSYLIVISNKKILTYGTFTALFTYFTIVHFGASTVYYFFPEVIFSSYKSYHYSWLESEQISIAILISILGQNAFILSANIFSSKYYNKQRNNKLFTISSKSLPKISIISLLIILIYFIVNIFNGNINFSLGYTGFKEFTNDNQLIGFVYFILATSYMTLIVSGNKDQLFKGNILYGTIAIILLLTGNKGEVMYAALSGVGIYYSIHRKISKKVVTLFLFLFFVVIPFITTYRSGSILGSLSNIKLNFLDPFLEIGWQLRTVEMVISWMNSGENFGYGISYFAPIERVLSNFTMGLLPPIPITNTPWSFGERLPGWGFSQIAESYYNFYFIGPLLLFFMFGWFASYTDYSNNNMYKKAFLASIIVILMIVTRNRFSFVPGQIVLALSFVIFAVIIDKILNEKKKLKMDKR